MGEENVLNEFNVEDSCTADAMSSKNRVFNDSIIEEDSPVFQSFGSASIKKMQGSDRLILQNLFCNADVSGQVIPSKY